MCEWMDLLRQFNFLTVLLRLFLAFLFGGCVGMERERRGRTAGLRTHILVCLGACLTSLCGVYIVGATGLDSDPLRIGAQVISGIGFLGAGTIMMTRQNHIKGLTTAAGLWTTAAIGLALGCGFYEGALVTLILALVAMKPLDVLERHISGRKNRARMQVYLEVGGLENVNQVLSVLKSGKLMLTSCEVEEARSHCPTNVGLRLEIHFPRDMDHEEAIRSLSALEHVLFAVELQG